MPNALSLDDIRAAADAKYASLDIALGETTVSLLNPLRLAKRNRDALGSVQERLTEDGADQEALLREALTLVARNKPQATALLREIGDDLAVMATIFERYVEGTQAGEASPSAD
ncbi:phage tail assembly protein [Salinispora pacifica]|uniref:phage tail assembly protein n=1 Tax=Salinispora pacifica TaxID=351187 RepID=UPI00035F832A|nr:phage tail assembly protein [Salinispora pacifica]